ncbi:MAG: hypothetical protein KME47_09525 [Nodosilinea sp. WJT8-NPBG4]|jgi:hypothetical protein|nr:hypothetical protein [Nodosilinea sp. WJT8-NPBG4]
MNKTHLQMDLDMIHERDRLKKLVEQIKYKCELVSGDVSPGIVDATYLAEDILELISKTEVE